MPETQEFKNKTIIVVGGGRGIGRAIAVGCAAQGANVVGAARSENELAETKRLIESAGGKCEVVRCDITREADVLALFDHAESMYSSIDGMVCAAGIYGAIGKFEDISMDEWLKAIDINLVGTARCVHRVIQTMKKQRRGKIVLFSGGGQAAMPRFSSYVTSKGAIWRLIETLGAEFASYGVFLNGIAPGVVNTGFLEDLLKAGPDKVGEAFYNVSVEQKTKGMNSPQKAVDLTLFLLSERCTGLHGRVLSAQYDPWLNISDFEKLSQSDVYQYRRVVYPDGRTKY